MKKIIVLLTVVCMLLGCVPVLAQTDNDTEFYKTAGLLPDAVAERSPDTPVSRGEAAYIFANIFGSGECMPCNTAFPDVTEENIYSGYIQYVIPFEVLPLESDGFFNPDFNVSVETVSSAMLKVLGYSDIVKLEKSTNQKFALKLGLLNNIAADYNADITVADFVTMFNNAMDIPVMSISSIDAQGNVTYRDSDTAYLTSILGMSIYEGAIIETMEENWNVRVRIEDNISDDNYRPAKIGDELTLSAAGNIDINKYKDVPCIMWVNSDDEIFYMMPQNNVEVRYAVIDSINGDTDSEREYSGKYIKKLTILDDKKNYKTEDLNVVYNLESTNKPVSLIGNYAKIVLKNNKVIFIESWDLEDGGIITEISNDAITYSKGIQNTAKIRNIADYEKKIVIIDGESVGMDRLLKDSVVSYYSKGGTLVLVVSEKIIDERFNGVTDNEIIIGDIGYMTGDTVYYAPEGEAYETDVLPTEMFGKEVHAYIDALGRCVYVTLAKFEKSDVFWAYVTGYETNTLKPDRIELMLLEPIGEKKRYTISKSVKINDDITKDELNTSSCDINGSGLFVFTCNKRGEINTISRPTPYWGFEDEGYSISQFSDDSVTPIVTVLGDNFYFPDARIIGLYYQNGDFSIKEVTWSVLRNANATGVKMRFYGKEESSDVMYAVLCGETQNIYQKSGNFGVVYRKSIVLDEFGKKMYKVHIAGKNGGQYIMTQEEASKLPEYCFVVYHKYRTFSDNDIWVSTVIDLTGTMDDWKQNSNYGYGVIKKIDEKRVYFEDGSVHFLNPYHCCFIEYNTSNKQYFTNSSVNELDPGDEVVYYKTTSGILGVIFRK